MERRLYRSRSDRMIWGVCGGMARYFNIDPVIIRIVFVLGIFANGLGILAYIILAIVVPLEGSKSTGPDETVRENVEEIKSSATQFGRDMCDRFEDKKSPEAQPSHEPAPALQNAAIWLGLIVIILGILLLLSTLHLWWFRWEYILPLILIAIGVLILVSWRRR